MKQLKSLCLSGWHTPWKEVAQISADAQKRQQFQKTGGGGRGKSQGEWFCKSSFLNLTGENANLNEWCWCGTFFSTLFMRLTISSLDIVGGKSNQESLRSLVSLIVTHCQSKQKYSNPFSFLLLLCNFFHEYPEWNLGGNCRANKGKQTKIFLNTQGYFLENREYYKPDFSLAAEEQLVDNPVWSQISTTLREPAAKNSCNLWTQFSTDTECPQIIGPKILPSFRKYTGSISKSP